jgi:hypothetical protein
MSHRMMPRLFRMTGRAVTARRLVLASTVCLLVAHCRSAQADEALRVRVASVAKSVSVLMHAQGMESISVGLFSGPPNFPSASGPAIVQMFHDEFGKFDIEVKNPASVGLAGEYSITQVPVFDAQLGREVNQLAVKISGRLVDQFGTVLTAFNTEGIVDGKFEATVTGAETFVQTIGLTAAIPADAAPHEVDNILRQGVVDPQHFFDPGKTRFRAAPDSPYEIEILIGGRPCPITLDGGLPYVEIPKGQVYAVRVYNNSPHDAAVTLLIDGMSVFAFSEVRHPSGEHAGQPLYTNYIIAPGSAPVIKGWHRTNQRVDSFLVTTYAESAAARMGLTQDIGTITVTFAAAWPKGGTAPPDEFISKSAGGNATGFGPPIEEIVEEAERDIGRVRSSLCIRYTR